MFNDQKPPVVTDDEVEEFITTLCKGTEEPLHTLISEVTDELAWASKDPTDGTEDQS
jgi:hypothetical protein